MPLRRARFSVAFGLFMIMLANTVVNVALPSIQRDLGAGLPDVEAWIFLAGTLLLSLADRLGGLLGERELEAIRAQRLRWLAGGG